MTLEGTTLLYIRVAVSERSKASDGKPISKFVGSQFSAHDSNFLTPYNKKIDWAPSVRVTVI